MACRPYNTGRCLLLRLFNPSKLWGSLQLRPELTWSHYRRLISVENEAARLWYMNEAADSVWSTRQTDMQLSTFMLIANALGLRFSLVVG